MVERIVLVNEQGTPIACAPKLESHNDHTPLHLAFSCYIFNSRGQFLLTRRAKVKKVWPGVWTNSVCGHPAPEESTPDAIKRRCQFELGLGELDKLEVLDPDYRYKTPPFNGIIENEFCPIYIGVTDQEPKPNPEEVDDYKWMPWPDVTKEIKNNPDKYSFWFKDQIPRIEKNDSFVRLSRSN